MRTRAAASLVTILAAVAAPLSALAAELLTAPAQLPTPSQDNRGALPADEAFAYNTILEADGDILLSWELQPKFYLYRKSLKLEQAGNDLLPALELPEGTVVTDEFFGESEVYFERLLARLPAGVITAKPGTTIELQLSYQGCLQDIYCYPPQYKTVSLTFP